MKTTEKQIAYLNQVKIYLRMFQNATSNLNKLWAEDGNHDLDLNKLLAPMFPFGKSFDELGEDIKLWVEDFEAKLSRYFNNAEEDSHE